MSRLIFALLLSAAALIMFVCPALAEPETCWVPQFVNCPDTLTMNHCDSISYRFKAVNPHSGKPDHAIRYHLVSGPGTIDSSSGIWWMRHESQDWTSAVVVSASRGHYTTSGQGNCMLVVQAVDHAPWLSLDGVSFGDTISMQPGEIRRIPVIFGDSDICDRPLLSAFADGVIHHSTGLVMEDEPHLVIEAPAVSYESISRVTVLLESGGTSIFRDLYVRLHPRPPMSVWVKSKRNVPQGQYTSLGVIFDSEFQQIGGYNFLIAYDNTALSFQSATMGPAFGPGGCHWEYFTYRFGAEGNCTGDCPSGLIRVVGMAETNNGPNHPLCNNPDSLPAPLFTLNFLTSNDRIFDCAVTPIRFFWLGCEDNMMSDPDGRELYISSSVAAFDDPNYDISNPHVGFPTYLGAQAACDSSTGSTRPVPTREIAFLNGFIEFICSEEIDARGDINLNGLPFEIADYANFVRYFERGLPAFTVNINGQIAASDVNHDDRTLSLTDLISLNRVIRGEIEPPVDPPAVSANTARFFNVSNLGQTLVYSPDTLGAVFLIYDGDVTPQLRQAGPELTYRFDGSQTRVLIAPPPGQVAIITEGLLLTTTPDHALTFAQAATWRGDSVVAVFDDITDAPDEPGGLPTSFALHPNYPNPFNPTTTISFDLPRAENVTLDIVNLLGQRVYTRTAQYNQGTHTFTWDGTDNSGRTVASGVYYFRLSAGEYSATQKMMLLK